MKFIKLTKPSGRTLYLNAHLIFSIEFDPDGECTNIKADASDNERYVKELPEKILELIDAEQTRSESSLERIGIELSSIANTAGHRL